MTAEELQAIRERFVAVSPKNYSGPYVRISAQSFIKDVPALLAEIDRLRAEHVPSECGWNVVHGLAQEADLRATLDDSMLRTRLAERVAEQARVAVAVEREACARIADQFCVPDYDVSKLDGRGDEAEAIATAIRARSVPDRGENNL